MPQIPSALTKYRIYCTPHDWRDGRVAEGAPLLREYGVCSLIEGSNPSLSETKHAPVAQLDRVPGYELGGREFESLRARQTKSPKKQKKEPEPIRPPQPSSRRNSNDRVRKNVRKDIFDAQSAPRRGEGQGWPESISQARRSGNQPKKRSRQQFLRELLRSHQHTKKSPRLSHRIYRN